MQSKQNTTPSAPSPSDARTFYIGPSAAECQPSESCADSPAHYGVAGLPAWEDAAD